MKLTKAEYIQVLMQFCNINDINMTIGEFAKMVNKAYTEYLLYG